MFKTWFNPNITCILRQVGIPWPLFQEMSQVEELDLSLVLSQLVMSSSFSLLSRRGMFSVDVQYIMSSGHLLLLISFST